MAAYMLAEELKFLVGDLQAGLWVTHTDPQLDDAALRGRFLAIHGFFLRNLGRTRPGLFAQVDPAHLLDIVRRWIVLYRRTLELLREAYPRAAGTNDLQLREVNWSESLGITFAGIVEGGINYASRYAEYWAERSVVDPRIFGSYDARLAFAGSPAYHEVAALRRADRLVVKDGFHNGVTAYDLLEAIRDAPPFRDVRSTIAAKGWHVVALDRGAVAALLRLLDTPEVQRIPCP